MLRPILLVKDTSMDVDLTRRVFARRKLDNPAHVARDGEEALALVEKWDAGEPRPVLILLDLHMRSVSGLEVLRAPKAHPVYKSVPVVVLTTSREDRDVHSACALGANSYIVKPVDFEGSMAMAEQIETYWAVLNLPDVDAA